MTNRHSNRSSFSLHISLAVLAMAGVISATANAQVATTDTMTQSPSLTVTYIAHCGFLFSSGEQKILTDALTEPSKEWPFDGPSPDLQQRMERGEPPFDHINVVLISHGHIDLESAIMPDGCNLRRGRLGLSRPRERLTKQSKAKGTYYSEH
jgi:hypothetical protein